MSRGGRGCPVGSATSGSSRSRTGASTGADGAADRPSRRGGRARRRLPRPLRRALPDPADGSDRRLRRRATSARSRPTTRRRSTAATSTGRRAGRSTRTAGRSTSTRSRTRTCRAAGRRIRRAAVPRPLAATSRHGVRGRCARTRLRPDRLGLGWPLVVGEGLPALLGQRPLRAAEGGRRQPAERAGGRRAVAVGGERLARRPEGIGSSGPPSRRDAGRALAVRAGSWESP